MYTEDERRVRRSKCNILKSSDGLSARGRSADVRARVPDNDGRAVCSLPPRRLIMVDSVKWVDEVIPRVPYDVSEAFMNELFEVRAAEHVNRLAGHADLVRLHGSF